MTNEQFYMALFYRHADRGIRLVGIRMNNVQINSNNNNKTAAGGGIGFCGLLCIVFIVLKLIGIIDWSWLWVLAPLWIPAAITIAVILLFLIISFIVFMIKGE